MLILLSTEHKQKPTVSTKCQSVTDEIFQGLLSGLLERNVCSTLLQGCRAAHHGQQAWTKHVCMWNLHELQMAAGCLHTFNKPKKWQPQHRTRVICNAESRLPAKQHWTWPNARVWLPRPNLYLSKSGLQAFFLRWLSHFPHQTLQADGL